MFVVQLLTGLMPHLHNSSINTWQLLQESLGMAVFKEHGYDNDSNHFDHAEVSLLNITHIYVVPDYKDQTKPRYSNYGKSHIFSPAVKMRLVTSLRTAAFLVKYVLCGHSVHCAYVVCTYLVLKTLPLQFYDLKLTSSEQNKCFQDMFVYYLYFLIVIS